MGKDLNGKEIGEGLCQRGDGRYQGSYSEGKQRKYIYDMKLSNLKRKLAKAKYEAEHGLNGTGSSVTVEEWAAIWFRNYKGNIRTVTKKSYLYYTGIIRKYLGTKTVSGVRQIHVMEMVNDLHENGYAVGSIKRVKSIAYNMFQKALENNLIVLNPVKGIIVSFQDDDDESTKALSLQEQSAFIRNIEGSHYRELFNVILVTGLRISEALGLRWSDIDFAAKELHVRRSLVNIKVDGRYVYDVNPTKSKTSRRTIPLCDDAIRFLNDQKAKTENLDQKGNLFNDMVFVARSGKTSSFPNINKILKTKILSMNRHGIEIQHISPHVLRHTFATRCYESGMSMKTISKLLGHSKIEITADIYTHVLPDNAKNEMSKLELISKELMNYEQD